MQRAIFLFFFLFTIFYLFPRESDVGNDLLKAFVLQTYKRTLHQNRNDLAQSEYYLGYGNFTGLELSYQDNLEDKNALLWPFHHYSKAEAWQENQNYSLLPDSVSSQVKLFLAINPVEPLGKAYHLNISGRLHGEFRVQTENHPKPYSFRLPLYLWDYYNYYRHEQYENDKQQYELDPENNAPPEELADNASKIGNITTYSEGVVELRIDSLDNIYPELNVKKYGLDFYDEATLVVMSLLLKNHTEADLNSFDMFGVYFQDTGALVGLTRSAKFRGNYALPHFTMNEAYFNKTKTLMSRLVNATNVEDEITFDDINRSLLLSQQLCELVSFFKFEKTGFTRDELRYIDEELQNPRGLPLPDHLPELEISHSVIYSPDCGIVLEKSPNVPLSGEKLEVTMKKVYNFFVLLIVVEFLNLNLFRRQTNANRTPNRLANVSKYSIFLLSLYDSVVCLVSVLYLWNSRVSLVCTCLGLISGILFVGLEVRYMTSVSYNQANERGTTLWEMLRSSGDAAGRPPSPGAQTDTADANEVGVAGPATQTTAEQNTANPETSWLYFDESSVLIRFIMTGFMLALIFLNFMLSATLWRVSVRRVVEYVGFLLINSYWVPQFFRNTVKNRKKTFQWEFVLGSSMVRLVPLIYLCLDRSNAFRHAYNPNLVATVALWLVFQIIALYLQNVLGARFWVNERWLPEQYNYHPVMNVTDLEHGFASDILASMKPHSEESGVSLCDLDCPICMSTVTIPVLSSPAKKSFKQQEKMMQAAMITPCHHIFHTRCMEDWMVHKLQCPVCRSPLPPV